MATKKNSSIAQQVRAELAQKKKANPSKYNSCKAVDKTKK